MEKRKRKEYGLWICSILVLIVACVAVWDKSGLIATIKNEPPQKSTETVTDETWEKASEKEETSETSPVTQKATEKAESGETTESTPGKPQSQDEIQEAIDRVCAAVNKAKHTDNFHATKDQNVKLNLDDCSIPGLTYIANPVISRLAKRRVIEYDFINGSAYDETYKEDVTPLHAIPPEDRDFGIGRDGVLGFETEKRENTTVYKFILIGETASMEEPVPKYHAMCFDYLNVGDFDLSPAAITQADFNYPGGTVTAELDESGNLVSFEEYLPLNGTGTGKLGLSVTGKMSGYMDEVWSFDWQK